MNDFVVAERYGHKVTSCDQDLGRGDISISATDFGILGYHGIVLESFQLFPDPYPVAISN